MAVPVLRYIPGGGRLQRRHPLVKLAMLVMIFAALFLFEAWYVPLGMGLALLAAYGCVEGGPRIYLALAGRFIIFMIFIIAAHLLLLHGTGTLTARAVSGLVQSVRIFSLLAATGLFLAVTDPLDLSDSFTALVSPRGGAGRRAGEISLLLMIVFGFLPLMTEEASRLRTAVGTRCGFGGGPVSRARNAVALLATLVVGVMRRADEIEVSLRARRYGTEGGLRVSRIEPGIWDAALLILSLVIFTVGVYYAKL